jgi:hypothetical protein
MADFQDLANETSIVRDDGSRAVQGLDQSRWIARAVVRDLARPSSWTVFSQAIGPAPRM